MRESLGVLTGLSCLHGNRDVGLRLTATSQMAGVRVKEMVCPSLSYSDTWAQVSQN